MRIATALVLCLTLVGCVVPPSDTMDSAIDTGTAPAAQTDTDAAVDSTDTTDTEPQRDVVHCDLRGVDSVCVEQALTIHEQTAMHEDCATLYGTWGTGPCAGGQIGVCAMDRVLTSVGSNFGEGRVVFYPEFCDAAPTVNIQFLCHSEGGVYEGDASQCSN